MHLPSVQAFQDELNSNSPAAQQICLPEPPYDPDSVKVESIATNINQLVVAMRTVVETSSKIVGFDLEWKPLYQKGMGGGDKVAVMQICYVDNQNKHYVLIFLLYRLTNLPYQLESLLMDESYTFVGVNVSGDFHKIGRDFNLASKTTRHVKNGVINLSKFARVRDVVQSGSVGLGKLCEKVLSMSLNKGSGV